MRLLILGGTQFVGRYITEAALAAGHQVTLFNRGRTNADLFPHAEKIIGDRNQDLALLRGREWDACIDVNAYVPRAVHETLEVLQGSIGHYVFISTISVYAHNNIPGQTEDAPLKTLDDPATEAITPETYGGLKVLCEQVAQEMMSDRILLIRPGFVVGPHDHTDRFPYWVRRAAQGGDVSSRQSKSSHSIYRCARPCRFHLAPYRRWYKRRFSRHRSRVTAHVGGVIANLH